MSVRIRGLALLLLGSALQGCGNSNSNSTDGALDVTDDDGLPQQDGEGSQSGDGENTAAVNQLVENPIPVGPEGDSGIMVNENHYPLDTALGDIWGVSDDHFNVNFTLSNGRYLLDTIEVDGESHTLLIPAATSAIVHAELYSPGEQFSLVSYSFSPIGDAAGALAGNAYFDQAYVGVDEDLSGDVEQDERHEVVGGSVVFSGTLPNIELQLSLTLETGVHVEGHYHGLFDFTER